MQKHAVFLVIEPGKLKGKCTSISSNEKGSVKASGEIRRGEGGGREEEIRNKKEARIISLAVPIPLAHSCPG